MERDLVGMEEVKTRLKRKGEEIEELKAAAIEKKKRLFREKSQRQSSRLSMTGIS